MPRWYYDKKELKQTPSIVAGLDYDTENRYRREGARFILDLGTSMALSHITMASGVVYYHRFYMFHTFQNFPRYPTACACLFLAGKVEETPKKCKDLIKNAKGLLSDHHYLQFAEDTKNPMEEIMTLERILLQTIKFDLQVEHPYNYLLRYAKGLKGDKQRLQKMVQMSWTFVNDSLCTTLCLQWEPEIIAIALMYLAGKLSKFEVHDWNGRTSEHLRWWDCVVENMSIDILEDICHQVLDLYSQTQNPGSSLPPSPPSNQPKLPPTASNSGTPIFHTPVASPNPQTVVTPTPNNSTPGVIANPPLPPGPPPPVPPPSSNFPNMFGFGAPPPHNFLNSIPSIPSPAGFPRPPHTNPNLPPQPVPPPLPLSTAAPPLPPNSFYPHPPQPPLPPSNNRIYQPPLPK